MPPQKKQSHTCIAQLLVNQAKGTRVYHPNCASANYIHPIKYDDALACDVERAEQKIMKTALNRKRKSVVALGELTHTRVRPNLLGPTLTIRFAETVNSSLSFFKCTKQ